MSVRILDHELGGAPRTVGNAFDDYHTGVLNVLESGMDVAHGNMEVKVLPAPNEVDAGVGIVHQLEVDHPVAAANPGVEILISKGEQEAKLLGIEADRAFEVRRAELGYEFAYLHRRIGDVNRGGWVWGRL